MIVTTEHKVANSKSITIDFPNLAHTKFLVPSKISFYTKKQLDDKTIENIEARNISAIVSVGGSRIHVLHEAFFQISNVVDLSDNRCKLNEGGDVSVILTNHAEVTTFTVEIEYVPSYGNIIYLNSYTEFSRVTKDIYKIGLCTRLILRFNRPVQEAELIMLFSRTKESDVDDEWFDTLVLGETEDNQYVIDFTDNETKIYPKYLNMMELSIPKNKTDSDDEDLKLYVVAYGYPRPTN